MGEMRKLERVMVKVQAQVECEVAENFSCLKLGRNLNSRSEQLL